GDAPDSTNNYGATMTAYSAPATVQANFPTVFNDGSSVGPYGPAHLNAPTGAFLGKKVTSEREADTGSDDDGANNIAPQTDLSDNDDGDDGVVVPLRLPHCEWATFDYQVTVVDPKIDLWVNVWIDFNRDGDWDDTIACDAGQAPEWAVQNQYLFGLPVGSSQVTTPALLSWHPKSGPAGVWMRITISEQPWKGGSNPGEQGNGGSGPATKYAIGETEDYYFIPDKTLHPGQNTRGGLPVV
ncbi:MAG: GEVED domain-containing protein, partial [Planctomycetota bacterium]